MIRFREEIKTVIFKDAYKAVDGTIFYDQEQCEKYENSAKVVIMSKYLPLVKKTILNCELCGDNDGLLDIVVLSKSKAKQCLERDAIFQLFAYYNSYLFDDDSYNKKRYQEAIDKMQSMLNAASDTNPLFIYRGHEDDVCFWPQYTKNELIDKINAI